MLVALVVLFACASAAGFSSNDLSALTPGILTHARQRGFVRCGSIVRPGLAVPTLAGRWTGLAVDVCRAIAAAALGNPNRMRFRAYLGTTALRLDAVDRDDVAFLTDAELAGRELWNAYVPGAVVFHDALALLVPARGAIAVAALGRGSVCVEPGTPADRSLSAYFATHRVALHEHPFQEPDEMRQAYLDGRCDALAGPLTTLANVRADPLEGRSGDRILPEMLRDDPVYAATTPGDGRWSALVRWSFGTLLRAEETGVTRASAGANRDLEGVPPAVGKQLGLAPGWTARELRAVGNYGEVYERNFGNGSRLRLARGSNALQRDGGSMFAPAADPSRP